MVAKVTDEENRSTATDIGVSMIQLDAPGPWNRMHFAEVDLGDHIAAVTVFGETQAIADRRARKLAAGWNMLDAIEPGDD